MTGSALTREQAKAAAEPVIRELGATRGNKLAAVLGLVGDDGHIPLADAYDVITTASDANARSSAFRAFRAKVAKAAKRAGVHFALCVDGNRQAGEAGRTCWIEGDSPVALALTNRARAQSRSARPDQAVAPQVSEVLGPESALRVYVSTTEADAKEVAKLLSLLQPLLGVRAIAVQMRSSLDIALGASGRDERSRSFMEADVVLRLLSSNYLAGDEAAWKRPCGCSEVIAELRPIDRATLGSLGAPMSQVSFTSTSAASRDRWVIERVNEIVAAAARRNCRHWSKTAQRSALSEEHGYTLLDEYFEDRGTRPLTRDAKDRKVESFVSEIEVGHADLTSEPKVRQVGDAEPGIARLIAWAIGGDHTPPLCALLGDLGSGKTTTAKLFTEAMIQRRAEDPRTPLVAHFDLRDLDVAGLQPGFNLGDVFTLLLKADDASGYRPTADEVLALTRSGACVVVFDGLDEVIVKLDPAQGVRFTHLLWRALPDLGSNVKVGGAGKILLTCRTHYFRDMRDESATIRGQDRAGISVASFLALMTVPFTEGQIRAYLEANVPGVDIDATLAMLAAIHDLRDLASRPLLLRLISGQLTQIEGAKLEGRVYRASDLYDGLVSQWLQRDAPKHTLLPEHKVVLMEQLAAAIVEAGTDSMAIEELELRMLQAMGADEFRLHYGSWTPDLFKEDLRTATFLVRRPDDRFSFAHTSLREYFHAHALVRALKDGLPSARDRWAVGDVSLETLHFVGQLLIADAHSSSVDALAVLHSVAGLANTAAELAFRYGVAAHQGGYPAHSMSATRLSGADLKRLRIKSDKGRPIDLSGVSLTDCSLRKAELSGVRLDRADLRGSDFSLAVLQRCDLSAAQLDRTNLTGAIFRQCSGEAAGVADVVSHRTHVITHEGNLGIESLDGVLKAPSNELRGARRLRLFVGHFGWVRSAGFDPSGQRVVSGGDDGSVRVWDVASGEDVRVFSGHSGSVWSVGFDPSGQRVVSGGHDGSVRVWDAASGEDVRVFVGHFGSVRSVGFDPSGQRVVSGGDDGSVRVWDVASGEDVRVFSGHSGSVRSVGFDPSGQRVVSGGHDGSVRVWDVASGEDVRVFSGHSDWVLSVGFDPSGQRVVSGGDDGSVRVWDVASGEDVRVFSGHSDWVLSVGFDPSGQRVVSGGDDGSVRVWDVASGEDVRVFSGHSGSVLSVGFDPSGQRVVSGGDDGSVRVWDVASGEDVRVFSGHSGSVLSVGFDPSGQRVVSGGDDGSVRVWDAVSGEDVRVFSGHSGSVLSVGFDPSGQRVVSGGDDGSVRVWDVASGEDVRVFSGHSAWVWSVGFDPSGQRVVSGGHDGSVRVWDAASGEDVRVFVGHFGSVWSVGFDPSGQRVVSGGHDGSVRVWDAASGEDVRVFSGHSGSVLSVGFDPSGQRVVSGGGDGSVRVWDAVSGEDVRVFSGHSGSVWSVGFDPSGQRVVSGGHDGSVRVWDAASGEDVRVFSGHSAWVRSVGFDPSGQRVVSGGHDGSVRVWDASTGLPIDWVLQLHRSGQWSRWTPDFGELLHADDGVWRDLGWQTPGTLERLPAESFGLLPS